MKNFSLKIYAIYDNNHLKVFFSLDEKENKNVKRSNKENRQLSDLKYFEKKKTKKQKQNNNETRKCESLGWHITDQFIIWFYLCLEERKNEKKERKKRREKNIRKEIWKERKRKRKKDTKKERKKDKKRNNLKILFSFKERVGMGGSCQNFYEWKER